MLHFWGVQDWRGKGAWQSARGREKTDPVRCPPPPTGGPRPLRSGLPALSRRPRSLLWCPVGPPDPDVAPVVPSAAAQHFLAPCGPGAGRAWEVVGHTRYHFDVLEPHRFSLPKSSAACLLWPFKQTCSHSSSELKTHKMWKCATPPPKSGNMLNQSPLWHGHSCQEHSWESRPHGAWAQQCGFCSWGLLEPTAFLPELCS